MSTIQDILRVEQESGARIAAAQQQAEEIKKQAQAEAAAIRAGAQARRAGDEQQRQAELDRRVAAREAALRAEVEGRLAERQRLFEQHATEVVDWMVQELMSPR